MSTITYIRLLTAGECPDWVCEQIAQELDERNAKITALTLERDRWQEDSMRQAATINRMFAATEDRNEVDQLRHAEHEKELAAAQAANARLWEALETISDEENWGEDGCWESSSYPDEIAMEALSTPTDLESKP